MTPNNLLRLCDELIEKGNKEEARKVARGISILTQQPAWQQAYDFIIDEQSPDDYISVRRIEINESIKDELNELHDKNGLEYKNQSLRHGTQVDLTNNEFFRNWLSSFSSNFIGIWTSRLQKGGYHVNHIHPRGQQSHVYYIDVPDNTSGHLQFGVPRFSTTIKPAKTIIPEMGILVSFPCWLWHGVSVYNGKKPRLTIAFDTFQ